MNYIEDFRTAMHQAGLDYAGEIVTDGKLHRFNCESETGTASWYVAHSTDSFLAAGFGCWRKQINKTWNSSQSNGCDPLTKDQWRELRARLKAAESERRTAEQQLRSEAKLESAQLLSSGSAVTTHAYLSAKRVRAHGEMRLLNNGCLALPIRDANGVLWSLQLIAPENRFGKNGSARNKTFIVGGKIEGGFYSVHSRDDGPLVICEGYATGASIHEATGYAVWCAMSCGNLSPVSKAARKAFPDRVIIVAADNDRLTAENPGVAKSKAVAGDIKAAVAIPEFADEDTDSTDFNDLARVAGDRAHWRHRPKWRE